MDFKEYRQKVLRLKKQIERDERDGHLLRADELKKRLEALEHQRQTEQIKATK